MKDLNFIEKVFGTIHYIWFVLCGIIALVLIVGMFNSHGGGETFSLFIALVLTVVLYFVGRVGISLKEIIYTRFIAATENILEITTMLEDKFNKKEETNK